MRKDKWIEELTSYGLDISTADSVWMAAINCRGNLGKERQMLSRFIRTSTGDYFVCIKDASSLTKWVLCNIGPQNTSDDNASVYNSLVRMFGFDPSMKVEIAGDTDEELDWDDDSWVKLDWDPDEELDWDDDELDWED